MIVRDEETPDPLELELLEARGTPQQWCWRVYSRRLHRVLWIARDAASAAVLVAGDRQVTVIYPDDLARLRDIDDRRLHARLDALAAARKMPPGPGEEET